MSDSIYKVLSSLAQAARTLKKPSERNQQIADAVRVLGRTQAAVAAEWGLSQRRVSQICQQVERWEGQPAEQDPAEFDKDARERADWTLQSRQLQEIYRRSMRAYERSEQPLKTTRRGERDGETWSDETQREQRLDTRSLAVAQRAIEQKSKLGKPTGPPWRGYDAWLAEKMSSAMRLLVELRVSAESNGDFPRGCENANRAVDRLLKELLEPAAAADQATETAGARTSNPAANSGASGSQATASEIAANVDEDGGYDEFGRYDPHRWAANKGCAKTAVRSFDVAGQRQAPLGQPAAEPAIANCEVQSANCQIGDAATDLQFAMADSQFAIEGGGDSQDFEADCNSEHVHASVGRGTQYDESERRAHGRIEYVFGLAMTRQQIVAALRQLRAEEAGRFSMFPYSRDQAAVLHEWARVRRLPRGEVRRRSQSSPCGPAEGLTESQSRGDPRSDSGAESGDPRPTGPSTNLPAFLGSDTMAPSAPAAASPS